jgi:PEP-CTERM motif
MRVPCETGDYLALEEARYGGTIGPIALRPVDYKEVLLRRLDRENLILNGVLFGLVFGLVFTMVAQADTITTFVASGEFGPPAGPPITNISFTGTITIDTTIGQLTSADIVLGFQDPATNITFTGVTFTGTNPDGGTYIVLLGPGSDVFSFEVDASDLVGYEGGQLLNAVLSPASLPESGGDFTPASPPAEPYMLTPESAVPEPTSLGLMMAGLFGVGLVLRSRLRLRGSVANWKAKRNLASVTSKERSRYADNPNNFSMNWI